MKIEILANFSILGRFFSQNVSDLGFFSLLSARSRRIVDDPEGPEQKIQKFVGTAENGPVEVGENLMICS